MSLRRLFSLVILALVSQTVVAAAQGGTAIARLRGFEEVPAISSPAGGRFEATINEAGTQIAWTLTYNGVDGVTQAHLHFAQPGVNGGIVIFLCSNFPDPPAGTPGCPEPNGNISRTIGAGKVVDGAQNQGIEAGQLAKVLQAIRAGRVYANVHSEQFPGGEIRGQLRFTPN